MKCEHGGNHSYVDLEGGGQRCVKCKMVRTDPEREMTDEEWIAKAKSYLVRHSTVMDSGTYGSGYELCASCHCVLHGKEKHKPECVLAELLGLEREDTPPTPKFSDLQQRLVGLGLKPERVEDYVDNGKPLRLWTFTEDRLRAFLRALGG